MNIPYRDSLDHASRYGVSYVAQAGGSVADEEVILLWQLLIWSGEI